MRVFYLFFFIYLNVTLVFYGQKFETRMLRRDRFAVAIGLTLLFSVRAATSAKFLYGAQFTY